MGKTLSQRWEQVKPYFSLADLGLDALGKFLLGLGLGALWAEQLRAAAWGCVIAGLGLLIAVKVKFAKRFWS